MVLSKVKDWAREDHLKGLEVLSCVREVPEVDVAEQGLSGAVQQRVAHREVNCESGGLLQRRQLMPSDRRACHQSQIVLAVSTSL